MASRTIPMHTIPSKTNQQIIKFTLLILSVFLGLEASTMAEAENAVIKQTSNETPKSQQPKATDPVAKTPTDYLLEHTNAYRKRYNLKPLASDKKLNEACNKLAQVMAKTGRMSHYADGRSPSSRVNSTGFEGGHVLENIAYRWDRKSKSDEQFAKATLQQWINSSGHRQNLLSSRVTHCGIAFATNPQTGKTFSAMVYAYASKATEKE